MDDDENLLGQANTGRLNFGGFELKAPTMAGATGTGPGTCAALVYAEWALLIPTGKSMMLTIEGRYLKIWGVARVGRESIYVLFYFSGPSRRPEKADGRVTDCPRPALQILTP